MKSFVRPSWLDALKCTARVRAGGINVMSRCVVNVHAVELRSETSEWVILRVIDLREVLFWWNIAETSPGDLSLKTEMKLHKKMRGFFVPLNWENEYFGVVFSLCNFFMRISHPNQHKLRILLKSICTVVLKCSSIVSCIDSKLC